MFRTDTDTIDDALSVMDAVIERAHSARDPGGYFAALYRAVTRRVRDGIVAGRYDDPNRMSRFDALFANRYFDALNTHLAAGRPTRPWRLAFEAASSGKATILQNLLLGMNAHINLDLAIAAAEVAPGDAIDGLAADFERINNVLAALLDKAQAAINRFAPLLGLLDQALVRVDESVANFSIRHAREDAWTHARLLARLPEAQRPDVIALVERRAELVAHQVINPL
ncbi:MAG: hypothetical protein KC620_11840, partial [Myxococcales bacterium]|nr:hypothetical protein [Myxococcales bacterium]